MIPLEFRDYFVGSSSIVQQEIISSLLSMSLEEGEIKDNNEIKAITCRHCCSK